LSAYPTRKTLADFIHASTKSIDRWNRELVEAGAMRIINRTSEDGDPTSNLYLLRRIPPDMAYSPELAEDIDRDTRVVTPRDTDVAIGRDTDVPRTIPSTNDNHYAQVKVKWARRWCELTGMAPTRKVLARFAPMVGDYIEATGNEPSESLLAMAKDQGINTPAGWAFVRGAAPAKVGVELPDCGICGNDRRIGETEDGRLVPYDDPSAAFIGQCTCLKGAA
jgi:hypothetical protein